MVAARARAWSLEVFGQDSNVYGSLSVSKESKEELKWRLHSLGLPWGNGRFTADTGHRRNLKRRLVNPPKFLFQHSPIRT
jgi:hypothetical protein